MNVMKTFTGTVEKLRTIEEDMKQEKLCESEDMSYEELGAENMRASMRQIGGAHYKKMPIQPWDIVDQGPVEQAVGFYRHNALKYIMRAGEKGDFKEDIQKAAHYLQKLLETL
mgnify:FL=1